MREQNGSTVQMVVGCANLVSYVSGFMTLRAGDVVLTGAPSGVGGVQTPPKFLELGDACRAGIDGLGIRQQTIVERDSEETIACRARISE